MIRNSRTLKARLGIAAVTVVLAGVTAGCSSGDSASPSAAPSTASASVTQSAPPASSSADADGWPADVPSPAGLSDVGGDGGTSRFYAGKGTTVDAVATQMTQAFTDAGYSIDGGQIPGAPGVQVRFAKGSTSIFMIVGISDKGLVSCALNLS
ncbi:MAG: hypothetical protein HQ526_02185 [Actinobacteria bacterium]|nr:hypothetical protein [Actinomycetota bacterium]